MSLNRILSQRSDVAWKEVNGSIILMDLGTEKRVHRLNSVGSFIWENLNGSSSLDKILELVCVEFEVDSAEAKADLLELIDKLERLGVICVP